MDRLLHVSLRPALRVSRSRDGIAGQRTFVDDAFESYVKYMLVNFSTAHAGRGEIEGV